MIDSEGYWPALVERALHHGAQTPFYLFAWAPIETALQELRQLDFGIPARHWLSLKTQPIPHLLADWATCHEPWVEVVSQYELASVLRAGYPPHRILVNGVAKHFWLPDFDVAGLNVQLDSPAEAVQLAEQARARSWRLGLRLHTSQEWDPDEPSFGGQFGMTPEEGAAALVHLRSKGISVDLLHFHLRSNVTDLYSYAAALHDLEAFCSACALAPSILNIGGGLPAPGIQLLDDEAPRELDLSAYAMILRNNILRFPSVREYWLENGRFLLARSGVLVVSVLEVKERPECRYLICDGGRTNHALVSDWERHTIQVMPPRTAASKVTTVAGPNCMAFDFLARTDLPGDIRVGDRLLWFDAGAYHIPWETRFSHGLAQVLWLGCDGKLVEARARESHLAWWQPWNAMPRPPVGRTGP